MRGPGHRCPRRTPPQRATSQAVARKLRRRSTTTTSRSRAGALGGRKASPRDGSRHSKARSCRRKACWIWASLLNYPRVHTSGRGLPQQALLSAREDCPNHLTLLSTRPPRLSKHVSVTPTAPSPWLCFANLSINNGASAMPERVRSVG